MNPLLTYFVRLCLLRSAPQQLPASPLLFWLSLGANLIAGVLLVAGARADLFLALLEGLADSLLLLLMLWLVLRLQGRAERFLQAATAFLGVSTLLALVAIPLLAFTGPQAGGEPLAELAGMLLLALIAWNMVVFGHILRHSFDVSLGLGVAFALAYTLFSYQVMSLLFPAI